MLESTLLYISRRCQRAAAAVLCLMVMQMAFTLASCQAEPVPMGAVRVHIGR